MKGVQCSRAFLWVWWFLFGIFAPRWKLQSSSGLGTSLWEGRASGVHITRPHGSPWGLFWSGAFACPQQRGGDEESHPCPTVHDKSRATCSSARPQIRADGSGSSLMGPSAPRAGAAAGGRCCPRPGTCWAPGDMAAAGTASAAALVALRWHCGGTHASVTQGMPAKPQRCWALRGSWALSDPCWGSTREEEEGPGLEVQGAAGCRTLLLSASQLGSSKSASEKEKKGLFNG